MIIVFSDDFIGSAKKLPSKQQIKLDKLIQVLKENPFRPSHKTFKRQAFRFTLFQNNPRLAGNF